MIALSLSLVDLFMYPWKSQIFHLCDIVSVSNQGHDYCQHMYINPFIVM